MTSVDVHRAAREGQSHLVGRALADNPELLNVKDAVRVIMMSSSILYVQLMLEIVGCKDAFGQCFNIWLLRDRAGHFAP